MSSQGLSRRAAVRSVAVAGVGAPLLVACGADEESAVSQPTPDASSAPAESESAESESAESEAGAAVLAATADIPIGGGKVFGKEKVVVVQAAEGEFKAYSAVCPHQACLFTEVSDNAIKCGGCHQSEFSSQDGSNTVGPNGGSANLPSLDEVALSVDGDNISLA